MARPNKRSPWCKCAGKGCNGLAKLGERLKAPVRTIEGKGRTYYGHMAQCFHCKLKFFCPDYKKRVEITVVSGYQSTKVSHNERLDDVLGEV